MSHRLPNIGCTPYISEAFYDIPSPCDMKYFKCCRTSELFVYAKVRSHKFANIGRVLDSICNPFLKFPLRSDIVPGIVHSSVNNFDFLEMKNTGPLMGANLNLSRFLCLWL